MDDRSEKIIAPTREIVRTNRMLESETSSSNIAMSFKTLCLVTCLAAAGGSAIAEWQAWDNRPINHYEKTELNALIFYAARIKNVSEEALRQSVHAQFNLTTLDDVTERDFASVRRYLQDKAQ
jgi:hypothetical protein